MRAHVLPIIITLTGCATHTWAPGPGLSVAEFEPAKARCSLMARHGGGSFEAEGKPAFVAGAMIGAAIGNAVRENADFNDCMEASGWIIADHPAPQVAAAGVPMTPANPAQPMVLPAMATIPTSAANATPPVGDSHRLCLFHLREKPEYAEIAKRFPDLATGTYTASQLTDTTVPTSHETALFEQYDDEAASCRQMVMQNAASSSLAVQQALSLSFSERTGLAKRLANGEMSWGDFSKADAAVETELEINMASANS